MHFRVLNNIFLVRKYFLHKKSIDRRPTLDLKAINAWMQNLNIFSKSRHVHGAFDTYDKSWGAVFVDV